MVKVRKTLESNSRRVEIKKKKSGGGETKMGGMCVCGGERERREIRLKGE